jgi:hypothetical protein
MASACNRTCSVVSFSNRFPVISRVTPPSIARAAHPRNLTSQSRGLRRNQQWAELATFARAHPHAGTLAPPLRRCCADRLSRRRAVKTPRTVRHGVRMRYEQDVAYEDRAPHKWGSRSIARLPPLGDALTRGVVRSLVLWARGLGCGLYSCTSVHAPLNSKPPPPSDVKEGERP